MSQIDLFSQPSKSIEKVEYRLKDGHLVYYPSFFSLSKVNYELLKEIINWRQDSITIYGRTHLIPRLQAWYSDKFDYSYSGVKLERNNFNEPLKVLLNEISKVSNYKFNGCLCNLYRSGSDYASWHSDDEDSLGRNPEIASVSFGEMRKFSLKHRFDKSLEKVEIELKDGSLLLMTGATQHHWKHQLCKTAKIVEPRINLTFRGIR